MHSTQPPEKTCAVCFTCIWHNYNHRIESKYVYHNCNVHVFVCLCVLDGNVSEGENVSPTDIEANLSTEVALTVLDVLDLFIHHHKVLMSNHCPACEK